MGRSISVTLSAAPLLLILATHRLVLLPQVAGAPARPGLAVLLLDLGAALVVAVSAALARRLHLAAAALLLTAAAALQLANLETVLALDTWLHLDDLRFALNGSFLTGSALHLSFPGYAALLAAAVLLYLLGLARRPAPGGPGAAGAARLVLLALPGVLATALLTPRNAEWDSANPLVLSLFRSFRPGIEEPAPAAATTAAAAPVVPAAAARLVEPEPPPWFRQAPGSRRNVLIVVLEGIPGAYLRQVQEIAELDYPILMPLLSRRAERGLIVPNFVSHSRQTIRGLYALLSGDYPRLELLAPKIYEYLQLSPHSRSPCLPEILARAGYATAYLQAADLAYMSKDQFLPAAGFRTVIGREHFRHAYVPFGWGPDDRAFFESAAAYIEELDRGPVPWLATLLNVGTHHPYAVPEEMASGYPSRKEAAVAFLDQALEAFLFRLEEAGVLSNTLVVITSDESHGVTRQPFGRHWGLALLLAPEYAGGVNTGVFGQVDLPYTVLDYLGMREEAHLLPRGEGYPRSLLRPPQGERPLLFGPYAMQRKGVIVDAGGQPLQVYRSANGELFCASYRLETVPAEEAPRLIEAIQAHRAALDRSLSGASATAGEDGRERAYPLLRDTRFRLDKPTPRVLSTGQYLDIPGGTRVTVELEAAVAPTSPAPARLGLLMIHWYEKMPLPELALPVLQAGDTLELGFSFRADAPLTRVWAYLEAASMDPKAPAEIEVRRFSVTTRADEGPDGYRVERLAVRSPPAAAPLPAVAHAGGAWGGLRYTNSVEALRANAGRFTLFEIDLEWTLDGRLVGLHDWDEVFRRLYGWQPAGPLPYEEFRRLRPIAGFHPVDLQSLRAVLDEFPEMRIVTDVKRDNLRALRRIAEAFPEDFAERFIPQIYQPEEFAQALALGYRDIIWTLYRYAENGNPRALLGWLRRWGSETGRHPFAVTLPVALAEQGVGRLVAGAGLPVYAHTVNSPEEVERLRRLGVTTVYTDSAFLAQ